ncbi:hypothetical protein D3C80_2021180 [compost metagenome]
MGGECATALVNEGSLVTLLTIRLGKAFDPVQRIGGLHRHRQQTANKKERQGYAAHTAP